MTANTASASRVSPWVGRWQTMDIPGDGSTNTLTIAHAGGGGYYRLIWQETYFTLCEGEPGIGRGTGVDSAHGMETTFNFYCRGVLTLTINMLLVYDHATDTFVSDPGGLNQTWDRVTPVPW
jgi:hypothetical protein